ncbi:hypothetical protein [Pseudoduganella sp. OTU4001]
MYKKIPTVSSRFHPMAATAVISLGLALLVVAATYALRSGLAS